MATRLRVAMGGAALPRAPGCAAAKPGDEPMRYDTVLFDMGNPLISYYTGAQWPGVLAEAIEEVAAYLRARGLPVETDRLARRVEAERGESDDRRVRPLIDRLARIFRLSDADLLGGAALEICGRFLRPIFALGRRYDDVPETLSSLRARGLRTGIVSNTPWGSPGDLWRRELARQEVLEAVDAVVFCTDVGWRKPAPQPFERILRRLGVAPDKCLFVGDDPCWDLAGPRGLGMDALLIDRTASGRFAGERPLHSLRELPARL